MTQTFPSMHKSIFLLIGVLFFYSCKKETLSQDPYGIIEPAIPIILEDDSLYSGQFWGINIGDLPEDVHTVIQQIREEKRITTLSIAGNVFTSIADLEKRIPLYSGLMFDELQSTPDGVQISFKENKIESIYLNTGESIKRWPTNAARYLPIEVGESVGNIYKKLFALSRLPEFTNKFGRLWLIYKNLSTPYDPKMSVSPQWYFGSPETDKKGYRVILTFSNGRLFSIHHTRYEYR